MGAARFRLGHFRPVFSTEGFQKMFKTIRGAALCAAVLLHAAACLFGQTTLPPGPMNASVSPTSLTVGSYTVAVQGTGFLTGAVIVQNDLALTAASLTSTKITR